MRRQLPPSSAALLALLVLAPVAAVDAQGAATSCVAGAKKLSTSSNIINDELHHIRWRADGCDVEVRFDGKLRFTDDWRTLAGLESDGKLIVEEDGPSVDRELVVRANADGTLRFSYIVDGARREMDGEGHAWLESVVQQLFRRSGYLAKERVRWMLDRKGPDAVLAEIQSMDGDYVRQAYAGALLADERTDAGLQARLLADAAKWSSDYYRAQLLQSLTKRTPVDGRVMDAAWKLIEGLDSDYYASTSIQRLLDVEEKVATGRAEAALVAVGSIESDHYAKEVLRTVARRVPMEGRPVELYLQASRKVGSDHYRAEALSALVDGARLSPGMLVETIRAAATISSEHYRSEMLARIAKKHDLTGASLDAYMAAAEAIGSSTYRNRAIQAVRSEKLHRI